MGKGQGKSDWEQGGILESSRYHVCLEWDWKGSMLTLEQPHGFKDQVKILWSHEHTAIHNIQQFPHCLLKRKCVYETCIDVILTVGDE